VSWGARPVDYFGLVLLPEFAVCIVLFNSFSSWR
jgi:hypothetical protein